MEFEGWASVVTSGVSNVEACFAGAVGAVPAGSGTDTVLSNGDGATHSEDLGWAILCCVLG